MVSSSPTRTHVESVRSFNRFYTRQLGLLQQGMLGSELNLTELRVLYELCHHSGATATSVARDLGLDAGYLSRLLKRFERRRYVKRVRSAVDGRQRALTLTARGTAAFRPLEQAAREQIAVMLDPMTPRQQQELVGAMQTVRVLLKDDQALRAPCTLRGLQVGDLGRIVQRQGILYAAEYGWDQTFEALLADILAKFVAKFDPAFDQAWVAERNGEIVGSVFLVRFDARVAKLRALYVEPSARGSGLGSRLVQECIDAARRKGYESLSLWTDDVLSAARRIYQAAGFKLTREEPHVAFGKDLIGQTWDLALR
jgi:DNA-binding MarR family transcriptional regulator/N-acetylglutamate synthase-like GNAT family acetyltransferase